MVARSSDVAIAPDGPRAKVGDPRLSRQRIAATLTGDILEIGPGAVPFPVATPSRRSYVDKSVPGGRDANWPELVGAPAGPDAEYDLDLDRDGLGPIPDASYDVVIACHVLEHLANPLAALDEIHRVLRPSGRLVLVLPDRTRTFDRGRQPTPPDHLLREYHDDVRVVSDEHILDFCRAIYDQPPMHPPLVREWHDPAALTPERYDLHRRRSIHVHCWDPQEFALTLAVAIASGVAGWRLESQYTIDDSAGSGIEFGLVLVRSADTGESVADEFVRDWVGAVLARPDGPARAAGLARGAIGLEGSSPLARGWAVSAIDALVDTARRQADDGAARLAAANAELAASRAQLARIRASESYRLATRIGRAARRLRPTRTNP